jgi:radical SAM protein with 4Fe4S-binding SPASM domain
MFGMTKPTLTIKNGVKQFRSSDYNYSIDLISGFTQRWGKTENEDPEFSPFGPEIADIEISSGAGCPMSCNFCYKGNSKGNKAENMSLEAFKTIFEKFPKYDGLFFIQQVALGITSIASMPDFFPICDYLRSNNVVPNVTINGADPVTDAELKRLISTMGAMAISINKNNFESGLTLIQRLISNGAKQINIHYVVSKQSIDFAYTLCEATKNDSRLNGLNAIVFLSLKPKERGQFLDILPSIDFQKLIRYCLDNEIRFGADSCSAHKVIKSFTPKEHELYDSVIEPCEASKFSFYFNNEGKHYPCSFLENEDRDIWKEGIDLFKINDFLTDVWKNSSVEKFRDSVSESNKKCNNCCHFTI